MPNPPDVPPLVAAPAPPLVAAQVGSSLLGAADQIANLALVVKAQAKLLAAQPAAAPPPAATVAFQPYQSVFTDDTHLVFAHYNVSYFIYGTTPVGGQGSVAGYQRDIAEARPVGIDGVALDFGDVTPAYTVSIDNFFTAAGSSGFKLLLTPDFSTSAMEDAAHITAIAQMFAKYAAHPACAKFQGRPVLSPYVGNGTGPAGVKLIYDSLRAQILALGVPDFLLWPMWGDDVPSYLAAGAGGGWWYTSGQNALGYLSPIPQSDGYKKTVTAAKGPDGKALLWMQSFYPTAKYYPARTNYGFYNEAGGAKNLAANMESIFAADAAGTGPAWLQLLTWNDSNEGGNLSNGASLAHLPGYWAYTFGLDRADFFQSRDGLKAVLAYYIQQYKTKQVPKIVKDRVAVFNRTQLAAVSANPANDPQGGFHVYGYGGSLANAILGEPIDGPNGLTDRVDVSVFLTAARYVQLSGVGPQQKLFASAGLHHLTFYNVQAGTPLVEVLDGTTVTCSVTGHAIAAAADLANVDVASAISPP